MKNKYCIGSLLWQVTVGTAIFAMANTAQAGVKYTTAADAGKQSCGTQYPANTRYTAAKHNLLKGGCWSCPRGFIRTTNPLPHQHNSCHKPRPYTNARNVGKASGMLNNICKGEPWLKNKSCWICPPGFKRAHKMAHGIPQCKPREKYFYHPAVRRGPAGCPAGSWSPLLSGNCYVCPPGYFRHPIRVSRDRIKDGKACMSFVSSKKKRAAFLKDHINQTRESLKNNQNLIKMAGEFLTNLDRIRKQKGRTGGYAKVTKQDIREAGGLDLLMASCDEGFPSISITAGVDGSYGIGANGSAGIAFGLVAECGDKNDGNDLIDRNTDFSITTLGTINGSIGPSAGLDASVNIGIWKKPYNELWGFAQGIVIGGSYAQAGLNGSAWWLINKHEKDEFGGISVGYQGGLSLEGEYNWGYTFQKH